MPRTCALLVTSDGGLVFVHDDDLTQELRRGGGQVKKPRRASHVEPTEAGEWTADLSPVGGPVLGPFKRRRTALRCEVALLDARMIEEGAI